MVPYNHDRVPGLAQWIGSALSVTVVLNQAGNVSFTNLDQISGRVVLRCAKNADVDSIIVKLEGESRTRLLSPPGQNGEKPKPQLEYHKILYKVQMAFPPADVLEGRSHMAAPAVYTLPAGQHEYPFNFKIPFNNGCSVQTNQSPAFLSFESVTPATSHVKQTLPPTLSGFPGEADVRYFVKATVNRHSFFKENPRAYVPFNFFPIEPPRGPTSGTEVFARQRMTLPNISLPGEQAKSKMKGLFHKSSNEAGSMEAAGGLQIIVDARLPQPAILTCNSDLPLRIIVKKLNSNDQTLYLQSLQIILIGHTKIRAHDVFRTESTPWVVVSKSNMGVPIGSVSDSADTEVILDDKLWRDQLLPNTIAPSFITCNIERTYQLDVRVGLSAVGPSQSVAKASAIILPLRLDAMVYSGIAPPAEALARMEQARAKMRQPSTASSITKPPAKVDAASGFGANQIPGDPINPPGSAASGQPTQASDSSAAAPPAEYEDAPPSYEDAIASDLPPVSAGNRPNYAPPPPGDDQDLARNEKSAWVS